MFWLGVSDYTPKVGWLSPTEVSMIISVKNDFGV
jgi:hypothetical protein